MENKIKYEHISPKIPYNREEIKNMIEKVFREPFPKQERHIKLHFFTEAGLKAFNEAIKEEALRQSNLYKDEHTATIHKGTDNKKDSCKPSDRQTDK